MKMFKMRTLGVLFLASLPLCQGIEIRGSSGNVIEGATTAMSSQQSVDNSETGPEMAVDGNRGMLLPYDGCALTKAEDAPWWRVDLGYQVPIAVVRIYGRYDEGSMYTLTKGYQVRIGMSTNWENNNICDGGENIDLEYKAATVINCLGVGRYLHVVAPNAVAMELSLCEVEVILRGPAAVYEWTTTVGRAFNIGMEGTAFSVNDRIRIAGSLSDCGEESTYTMSSSVLPRWAPDGTATITQSKEQAWKDVKIKNRGFYKVCWCSGIATDTCSSGADFTFIAGYIVVTGEFRTIVGPDVTPFVQPSDDVSTSDSLRTVNTDTLRGITADSDGYYLWFTESHRLRQVDLENGTVTTVVGSLNATKCNTDAGCGDGGLGTAAGLATPTGISFCEGEVLIADTDNHRIRAYNPNTMMIRTVAGTTSGYSGDDGSALEAQLKSPKSVACDSSTGFWISDSGNNAIRLVNSRRRRNTNDAGTITTVAGGIELGSSEAGDWSNLAHVNNPGQIAMVGAAGYDPTSWAYTEIGKDDYVTPYVRYVPVIRTDRTGPVQTAAGTGEEGYASTDLANDDIEIALSGPQGLAADSTTMFIADTENHRILMVPFVQYSFVGCYTEYGVTTGTTLIPSVESEAADDLSGDELTCADGSATATVPIERANAIQECARATHRLGYTMFAVRCGGLCATAEDAEDHYSFLGSSTSCSYGRGGYKANSVYRLLSTHALDLMGKVWKIAGTAYSSGGAPAAGFYGDWSSSWTSAVDTPMQMAYDPSRRNLYIADAGNKRIRAIMGTLGPSSTTNTYECTNGLTCRLTIKGNALSSKDYLSFSRLTDAGVECGTNAFTEQFPNFRTRADTSDSHDALAVFGFKAFILGELALTSVGDFKICFCYGGELNDCDEDEEYEFAAGTLTVSGPNAAHEISATAGVPFDIVLRGHNLGSTDAIRLIPADEECGVAVTAESTSSSVANKTVWWIGCFLDDENRDFDIVAGLEDVYNIYNSNECANACDGWMYMALEAGICRCGNAYQTDPVYVRLDDSECGDVCVGEAGMTPTRYCGYVYRNAVYRIRDNTTATEELTEQFVFPTGDRVEGDETYEYWSGSYALSAMDLKICWCGGDLTCENKEDFLVHAGDVHIHGPVETTQIEAAGIPFDIILNGTGSGNFKSSDRLRLQLGTLQLGTSNCWDGDDAVDELEEALPYTAAPCAISAASERWCNIVVNTPGDYVVCWCGGDDCSSVKSFLVFAKNLTITEAPEETLTTTSGPFRKPAVAKEPLATGWPDSLDAGSETTVTISSYTRTDVLGAGCSGSVEAYICEDPDNCLESMPLSNLYAGWTNITRTLSAPSSKALRPMALKLEALSDDAWLPEFLDVEIGSSAYSRRIPVNRWLVLVSGDPTVLGDLTYPEPTLPVASSLYTTGDDCGGCARGYHCVELQMSALSLARLGLSLSTQKMAYQCTPQCGNGLIDGEEQCDDGNLQSLDGCSSDCTVEAGFECYYDADALTQSCMPESCNIHVGNFADEEACSSPVDIESVPDDDYVVVCRLWNSEALCEGVSQTSYVDLSPRWLQSPTVTETCQAISNTSASTICGLATLRPNGLKGAIVDQGRLLIISFDAPLMKSVLPANGTKACEKLLSSESVAALGDRPICSWGSSRHIEVQLGFGATIGFSSEYLRFVSVLDQARQHESLLEAIDAKTTEDDGAPAQNVTLTGGITVRASDPTVPIVFLRGPTLAWSCGPTVIDASLSTGSLGQPWAVAEWGCSGHTLCSSIIPDCDSNSLDMHLSAGATASCLTLTIPESIATTLGDADATIQLSLTLTNFEGISATGSLVVTFTDTHVPIAEALTPTALTLPADESQLLRLEVFGQSSDYGSCTRGKSLGPVEIAWRVGRADSISESLTDLLDIFDLLEDVDTSYTEDLSSAVVGNLSSWAVAGVEWIFVARVAHSSTTRPSSTYNAAPAFVKFSVTIVKPAPVVHVEAPQEVPEGCPFELTATLLVGDAADMYFTWSCTRTDLTSGTSTSSDCDGAVGDGLVYGLPATLPAGIYRLGLLVESGDESTKVNSYVRVNGTAGPMVSFAQPDYEITAQEISENAYETVPVELTISGLDDSSCGGGEDLDFYYVLLLHGRAPNSLIDIDLDVRRLDVGDWATWGSSKTVSTTIDTSSLKVGLQYHVRLYLTENRSFIVDLMGDIPTGGTAWPPSKAYFFSQPSLFSYTSRPFSRALSPFLALWAEPSVGIAARTLFSFSARALCESCLFEFHYAKAILTATNSDGTTSCEDLIWKSTDAKAEGWLEFRPWSVNPNVSRAFLEGNYTIKVTVKSEKTASTSNACLHIEANAAELLNLTAVEDDEEAATELITEWAQDVSQTLENVRSSGEVDTIAQVLFTATSSFPTSDEVSSYTAVLTTLRTLYTEVCDCVRDLVEDIPASQFAPVARLLSVTLSDPALTLAAESLYLATDRFGPLLALSELWEGLGSLQSFLARNEGLHGTLGGTDASDEPPQVGVPLVSTLSIFLNEAKLIENASSAGTVSKTNASALVSSTMSEVLRLGDHMAAALPTASSGYPVQVPADTYSLVLSVKHFKGGLLKNSGILMDLPLDSIERPPFSRVYIPPVGTTVFSQLTSNLTSTYATSGGSCLGSGVDSPMDSVVLTTIHWEGNPYAELTSSSVVDSIFVVRDIRLRSCGVSIALEAADLAGVSVEFVTEVPEEWQTDTTTGYGSQSQFQCVRWQTAVLNSAGSWVADGCVPTYRPLYADEIEGIDVSEGAVHCACEGFWPGTWALQHVEPVEDIIEEDTSNRSSHNLVSYALGAFWLVFIGILFWAAIGDFNLALDGLDEEDSAARLLPWALDQGLYMGSCSEARAKLSCCPLFMRCVTMERFLTIVLTLVAIARGHTRREKSLQVDELPMRRAKAAEDRARRRAQSSAKVMPGDDSMKPGKSRIASLKRRVIAPKPAPGAKDQSEPEDGSQSPLRLQESADKSPVKDAFNLEASSTRSPSKEQSAEEWGQEVRAAVAGMNTTPFWQAPGSNPGSRRPSFSNQTGLPAGASFPNAVPAGAPAPPGAPPEGWIAKKSDQHGGRYYWVNLLNGQSTWTAPKQPAVKEMSIQEMRALLGPRSDQVHLRSQLEDLLRGRIAERMQEIARDRDGEEDDGSQAQKQQHGLGNVDFLARGLQQNRQFTSEGSHRAGPPSPLPAASGPPLALKPTWEGEADALRAAGAGEGSKPPSDASPAKKSEAASHTSPPAQQQQQSQDGSPKQKSTAPATTTRSPSKERPRPSEPFYIFWLQFVDYSIFRVFWLCWIRSFPLLIPFLPRLVQPRFPRAASVLFRLSVGLALAVLCVEQGLTPQFDEDIQAETRSFGDLFKEVDTALSDTSVIIAGILAAIVAPIVTGLLTPATLLWRSPYPDPASPLPDKVRWYRIVRRRLYLGGLAAFLLSLGIAVAVGIWATLSPQPRSSVVLATFLVTLFLDIAAYPIVSALVQTILVNAAGRSGRRRPCFTLCCCCCGALADSLCTQLPWLLDFLLAQLSDWSNADLMVARLRLWAEEQRAAEAFANHMPTPQPLGFKVKRVADETEDSKVPNVQASAQRPPPGRSLIGQAR